MRITDHFSFAEMTTTSHRQFLNLPSACILANLTRLCESVLEPMREAFGPIHINSGYRSPDVNRAVGGSPKSAHMDGRAADLVVLDDRVSFEDVRRWLEGQPSVPWDMVIREYGRWLHCQVRKDGSEPRRRALRIDHGTGYEAWA